MRTASSHTLLLAAFTVLALGCGDDDETGADPKPDAEAADAGASDAESEVDQDAERTCTKVPEHGDIINAASASEKVEKRPVLPLLKSDGTLPSLP